VLPLTTGGFAIRFSRLDFVRRDIVGLAGLVVESVIAT
jgi:hypothetical protein